MANRTNSNSLVLITINKLNNKTSGFRYEMIKKMGLYEDTIFKDGTFSTIEEKEMNGKKVDIIAEHENKDIALIEVKVGINEDLQSSQRKKGEYEKLSKKYGMKLFYIIPEDYSHQNELPDCGKIFTWEEIVEMDSVKGTQFSDEIKHFSELNNDSRPDLITNISLFTTLFTKFLLTENLYHEPTSFYNKTLKEKITWYDLTDDEELSIGISTETGNVFLYVMKVLFDCIDSSKFATVINKDEDRTYSKFFDLSKDVKTDDLETDSKFITNFEKKIKKLVTLAKKELNIEK